MKKMQCEVCGSTDIKKIDDTTFECQSCGVQYSNEEVKKLLVEITDCIEKSDSNEAFTTEDNNFVPQTSVNDNIISEKSFVTNGLAGASAKDAFEIDKLVRCAEKIKAIGVYRESTGVGFADAVKAIEKYMQDNGIRCEIKAVSKKKGWF